MSTLTGKDLNLVKPALTDDYKVTIGTDLPANFQKIDDEFTAHLAEDMTLATVHGLRYEEGGWTPNLHGVTTAGTNTYSTQIGHYIKINKKVTCYGHIVLSAKDAAMAGDVKIGGLPFVVNGVMGSISFGYISNIDSNTGELYLAGYPLSTRVDLIWVKDNGAVSKPQPAQIQNNTEFIFVIEYYTS